MQCMQRWVLKSGQLLTKQNIDTKVENISDECEYISIPITTSDDALAYKIKKGSVVNIYFTGKVKQVEKALKIEASSVYSSSDNEAIVTTKLYENIEIAGVYDSVGSIDTMFTQVVIRVNKQEVARLVNLKNLGEFTLTLVE